MKNILLKILFPGLILSVLFSLFSIGGQTAFAQDISLSASIDENIISLDDQLTLKVSASGKTTKIPSPTLPDLPDFTVYSSGRSQNVSLINGKFSSSVTFNYILSPRKAGKYTIPPITLSHKGTIYKTSSIDIEVTSSAAHYPPYKSKPPQTSSPREEHLERGEDLFITTSVDKKTSYVNEQIILSFKFYRRVRLLSQPQYSPPDTTGFWFEDLPPQKNYDSMIKDRQYTVTEIKTALFPTSPGKYTIGSANLKCNIEDFSRDDFLGDSFFQSFFSGGKTKTLKSSPIQIKVLPLPEKGKPENFTGAVGKYSVATSIDKDKIQVNQPITLTISISGKGNLKTISLPLIKNIKNFKKYKTVSSLNLSKKNYTIKGSKTFTTMIVPQKAGEQTISMPSFSFFNPKAKKYKTINPSPIKIEVLPASKEETSSLSTLPQFREGIKILGEDIRYIKTNINNKRKVIFLYQSPLLIGFQLGAILILFLLRQYKKQTDRLNRDIGYARKKQALKTVNHTLKKAKRMINLQNTKEFYSLLANGLLSYLGNKLNFAARGITREELSKQLKERNIPQDTINQCIKILENSDFARFASSKFNTEDLKNDYQETTKIIKQLEKLL
ncbi:protein BatD [bacterium]|nr:protein BatD [bacterium]